jgi:hypothetical protein
MTVETRWPALHQARCRSTLTTLHRYTEVVGKIRLGLTPVMPQWANSPLRVTSRGLTTMPMWADGRSLQIDLDLVDHVAVLASSDGARRSVGLQHAGGVAGLRRAALAALDALGVAAAIDPGSLENAGAGRGTGVLRCVLRRRASGVLPGAHGVSVLEAAPVSGASRPGVALVGTFDLSVTRFSGRPRNLQPAAASSSGWPWTPSRRCAGSGGRRPERILRLHVPKPPNRAGAHRAFRHAVGARPAIPPVVRK